MAAGFSPRAAGTPVVHLTDAEKEETCENGELTLLFHLSVEMKIKHFKLGGYLHRSLNLQGFVKVIELGFNWYAAKFKNQIDYDIALGTSPLWVFRRYQIEFYRWVSNFQPFLLDEDIIQGRVQQIPPEYCTDRLLSKIAVTACASLECRVLMVDSKSSRFFFQSIGTNSCSRLPLQIQIACGGPLVGLSYSPVQQCYNCGGFGHLSTNCRGNRTTSPSPVPTHAQVRRPFRHRPLHPQPVPTADPRESETRPLHPQPVPMADPRVSETRPLHPQPNPPETHLDNTNLPETHLDNTNPPETHEETTPMAPRSIPEIEMPPKGAINVEMGRESKPIVYTLLEEVSEINVTVNVTPLNDPKGNQRRLTIDPRTDTAAPNCTKRVIYTSIDGVEDQDAIRMLLDKFRAGDISVAIVLDKSSVLLINDGIVRYLGFSASHRAEMTFPSFGSDGSAGNCLIMWKREEVRVDVSAMNTERHLKFSALWVVGESDEEDSDGLSHDFTTTGGEEGTSDNSDSSESSSNRDTDSEVSSLYYTAREELSNESNDESPPLSPNSDINLSPYYGDVESDSEGTSFFSVSGGESSFESSTVSSNRDTNSEESWSSSTDAEEISYGSSAPSISLEEGDDSFS